MGIFVLPNANSLDVLEAVVDEMGALQKDLPVGMDARVNYDSTDYIRTAIKEVIVTLAINKSGTHDRIGDMIDCAVFAH